MERLRGLAYYFLFGALISSFAIGLIACQRSPRKACNPPCLHGAPCVEGVCQCPLPYEGSFCESDARDRFMGVWEGRRRCGTVRSGLRYSLWKHDSLLFYLYIGGSFYGMAEETLQVRLIDPYQLFMPQQILRDTSILISGYGEVRHDSLYLRLYLQGSANRIDTCFWDLKRR